MLSFYIPNFDQLLYLPFVGNPVRAGFPSPAEDYIDDKLDLNEHLVAHPNATFYVRVSGDSMIAGGIHNDDTLVVDRSLKAENMDIVIASINGEFTVKKLETCGRDAWLVPCNPAYSKIRLTDDMDVEIWGVVTSIIHQCRK